MLTAATDYVRKFFGFDDTRQTPSAFLISGSGLRELASEPIGTLSYTDIPGFPDTSVEHHGNELVLQEVAGKLVLAMSGRLHLYEGHSPQDVTFPVRLAREIGIETLIITNAAGGL